MKHILASNLKRILLCGILFFLLLSSAYPKKANKTEPPQIYNISFQLESNPIYDNNILGYSEKYNEMFKQGSEKDRFRIKTFDDVFFKNTLKSSVETEFIKKLPTQLCAQVSYYSYLNNPVKSWLYANIGLKQDLSSNVSFKAGYSVIPHYYVRDYRDKENLLGDSDLTSSFLPFEFGKENFYSWLQYEIFPGTGIQLDFSYYRYFHNMYFTEYDSKNYQGGIKIEHSFGKAVNISLEYQLSSSKAKGYDQPGESRNSSDDPDASYDGEGISFDASWKLPKLFNCFNSLEAGLEWSRNFYRSGKSPWDDPLHAGRKDYYLRFNADYEFAFNSAFSLMLDYYYAQRRAGSVNEANDDYISVEKDFDQQRFGLTFLYKIKFKQEL